MGTEENKSKRSIILRSKRIPSSFPSSNLVIETLKGAENMEINLQGPLGGDQEM